MVQQNMFPQEIRTTHPPQRAKPPQPTAPASSTKQQAPQRADQATQLPSLPGSSTQNPPSNAMGSSPQQPNSVRLSGRVGRYFEVRQTQAGKSLARFTLATVEPYRDDAGNWAKRTVWRRIVAWDETARAVGELIAKGVRVSVEGKFKTREWTDGENNLRTTTELIARRVEFLDTAAA